ncbi:MAG: alpha-ketoacid dehydrogenase subunit beta [Deltaproteobacteria bacterium CG11_big_fil_rev_8_21_14_0_20_47_16]|nr:MAG: alpha-ketoacid dehydrogenase subunit beta [Deltaproteobacteria bacterium CG11_big_fil_rev_8_21_14_0_20_47_16]
MVKMNYMEAVRDGMRQAMIKDERAYIYGEDVGFYGGVFGVTKGLFEEFGPKRVRNTPLSECAILGEAMGAALNGLRPIPEIQFADFITVAMAQLVDCIGTYRYRFGYNLPITIRMPSGGGMSIGPFHSKSLEAWFIHSPGFKIVMPSTPSDAKGLFLAAFEDPDPVLFMEHKRLYNTISEDVQEGYYTLPLGKAAVRREGNAATIVTYGGMVGLAMDAADILAKEDIAVEVIDLRTLWPLDEETVLNSIKKTNRVLMLHEAVKIGGFGGELVARVCEKAFGYLAAPPLRMGAKLTAPPVHPVLEKVFLPQVEGVVAKIKELLQY